MDDRTWETPEVEVLTDADLRADRADVSVQNGGTQSPNF